MIPAVFWKVAATYRQFLQFWNVCTSKYPYQITLKLFLLSPTVFREFTVFDYRIFIFRGILERPTVNSYSCGMFLVQGIHTKSLSNYFNKLRLG